VKIHLLYVVRGTVLEEWYRKGEYQCLTKEDYVSIIGDFLALLPANMIIQRLTGDPHPDELVAPQWALDKGSNLRAIGQHMEQAGIHQGKAYAD
jgi:hypothetical protein